MSCFRIVVAVCRKSNADKFQPPIGAIRARGQMAQASCNPTPLPDGGCRASSYPMSKEMPLTPYEVYAEKVPIKGSFMIR
jgi:hypothetical protein